MASQEAAPAALSATIWNVIASASAARARAPSQARASLRQSLSSRRLLDGRASQVDVVATGADDDAASPPQPTKSASMTALNGRIFPDLLLWRGQNKRGAPPEAGGARKPSLYWFREDLRLDDHFALSCALENSSSVVPVLCLDPSDYAPPAAAAGAKRAALGPTRARFVLASAHDLRKSLREKGSDLVVRVGKPADVLPELAKQAGAAAVYCQRAVSASGARAERDVRAALQRNSCELKLEWGSMLHAPDQIPYKTSADVPATFAAFHRAVANVQPRAALPVPKDLKPGVVRNIDPGSIPTERELGISAQAGGGSGADAGLVGGESEALRRLKETLAAAAAAMAGSRRQGAVRREVPAPALADPNSLVCKLSPWLTSGCLSPRRVYEEACRAAGGTRKGAAGGKASTPLLELLWRDYFTHQALVLAQGSAQKGTGVAATQGATAVAL
ncbi:unnamed protein product [Pedinophyceae sp. YPF-701]|nr:unnamed protein product [Pedinophyceae sp. YPF-701]